MRPDLPKKLAGRIRAAQAKVSDARRGLFWGQHKLMEIRASLKEYSINPAAWAEERYPGHGLDSYPVVTKLSRLREEEIRQLQRKPERIVELREADMNLARTEREVGQEVNQMRPSAGRIPYLWIAGTNFDLVENRRLQRRRAEALGRALLTGPTFAQNVLYGL